MTEQVNHPAHYGGESNPYEVIKVIETLHLGWGFCLGNALKYIARAPHKSSTRVDLEKARWYTNRIVEKEHVAPSNVEVAYDINERIREAWGVIDSPFDDIVHCLIDGTPENLKKALLLLDTHLETMKAPQPEIAPMPFSKG